MTKTCKRIVKTVKNIQLVGNSFPKKLILISRNNIKGKSKCDICLTKKTFIHKIEGKFNLERELEICLQSFTD